MTDHSAPTYRRSGTQTRDVSAAPPSDYWCSNRSGGRVFYQETYMQTSELIERLRIKAGHNQYKFSDALMIEAADAIESLLVENERLKHNLAVTEQTMR